MSIAAVNVTTSSSVIVAPLYQRKMLMIQNVSDTDIYLKLDDSATALTTGNGIKLASNSAPMVISSQPGEFTHAISAIHAGTGDKEVRLQEWYS
tara:strand:+ start:2566 stop:2847 length:282 start_codon:yes stop_codon:yes gene_type:complete